ncbi:DUF4349 domain-containing protein [Leucobacter chromiireducens]|uniref:DUF4349 domain-containing protein n=1 Tax=Leucobacter chromiireducens TaxID=283877 RepID=UPI000F64212B|nr:DUF4349 domain-containing protein [Leucobacter chromiireducens]
MMRRRSLALLAAAGLLLAPLSACAALPGGAGGASDTGAPGQELLTPEALDGATLDGGAAPGELSSDAAGARAEVSPGEQRSITRSADLSLNVSDVDATADRVVATADAAGGRVESRSDQGAVGTLPASSTLTIRVPADRLDATLDELSALGEVTTRSVTATDVTTEHVDLTARVAALQQSIERLTKLMADASTTSELLEAESALASRQQELDGLSAQLKWLNAQVDESTIWVSLNSPSALPGGPTSFWDGVLAGFRSIGAAASGGLVVLGILLPWAAIAGVITAAVLLIVRAVRRRGRRERIEAPAQPAAQEHPDERAL